MHPEPPPKPEAVSVETLQRQFDDARAKVAEARRATTTTTTAPVEEDWATSNLSHVPRGLSVMLVEPFPWEVGGNRSVQLAFLELAFWYPLLALAVVGVVGFRCRRQLVFPILIFLGVSLMYGLAEGNFGTAYRHRGELTWAVAILAAAGAQTVSDRYRTRRA